jgi:3-hydroxyisobutyrate dehydrogenase-like beta-hydroxyacid dehydrogenase
MEIGTIGAGALAQAFAKRALKAGHKLKLSNDRGPDCQHRYKTTAFPSVLLLGREAYGEDVVRTL